MFNVFQFCFLLWQQLHSNTRTTALFPACWLWYTLDFIQEPDQE